MNKKELASLLKRDILKLAKKKKVAGIKDSDTKDTIIKAILKSEKSAKNPAKKTTKAVAKKSAKKAVTKTTAKTKKTATKKTAKEMAKKTTKAVAKKPIKKAITKTTAKTKKTATKKTAKKMAKKTTKAVAKKPIKKATRTPKARDGFAVKVSENASHLKSNLKDAEESVSDAKYHIAEQQGELYTDNNIPHRYEDDRVFLFVRDPQTLFTAWDISHETVAVTAKNCGINLASSELILRLYDVTDIDFNGSNAHSFIDINPSTHHGSWYFNNLKDGRSYIVDVGLLSNNGKFAFIARSNMVGTPRASVSDRVDEEWMVADEKFWKFYALSGGFAPETASSELPAQMQKRLAENLSSMGSGSHSAKKDNDDFYFRLNCELIIYGQTEPDASLTLRGEKIALNIDGTFSARYALPDSLQIIEAEAESKNKKHRKSITPTVSRSTISFENHTDRDGEDNE